MMREQFLRRLRFWCLIAVVITPGSWSLAADGDPVALRKWPDGMLSIETFGNQHLVLWPSSDPVVAKQLPRFADLVLFSKHPRQEIEALCEDVTVVVPEEGSSTSVDHSLCVIANAGDPSWVAGSTLPADTVNSVHVTTVDLGGAKQSADVTPILVEVDGLRMLFMPSRVFLLEPTARLLQSLEGVGKVDLVYLDGEAAPQLPPTSFAAAWEILGPRVTVLGQSDNVPGVTTIAHNTLAISKANDDGETRPLLISLSETPWPMTGELEVLFEAMEDACDKSQRVMTGLTTNQMSFRPSNGTHSPRWNAEHMMGRQLLFFSQIYHEQNAAIPVRDWNPKQMPRDYVAGHEDWSGAEESNRMQQVSAFSRRFAYLLDGLDLDQPAPGSRWTPRALLKQMARHYDEHTANTVKKFELADWPAE